MTYQDQPTSPTPPQAWVALQRAIHRFPLVFFCLLALFVIGNICILLTGAKFLNTWNFHTVIGFSEVLPWQVYGRLRSIFGRMHLHGPRKNFLGCLVWDSQRFCFWSFKPPSRVYGNPCFWPWVLGSSLLSLRFRATSKTKCFSFPDIQPT
jgi:hypothetical protein